MNLWINSVFIFLMSIFNLMHPVHVSIINMDYLPEQNKISLSFKVFKDDFQLLFAHLYQVNIDFDNEENYSKYQKKIDEYFSSHFKITEEGGENKIINYIGIKKNQEAIWFHYEASIENELKSLKISNTILLDLYFDQKNLLILKYGKKEKGYQFNLKQTKQIIEFDDF